MSNNARNETTSWIPLIAVALSIFLIASDQIVLPVAAENIVADLNTRATTVQAALAILGLIAAPLHLVGGKLGEIHGNKRIFLAGIILYLIASLTATLAPNATVFLGGWSILRGVALACLIPTGLALLISNYQAARRGQAFSIYGISGPAAALVMPIFMGWAASSLSWRLTFGLHALIALVCLFLTLRMVDTTRNEGLKMDWLGALLAFLGVGALVLGPMLAGNYGWWEVKRPFQLAGSTFNPLGLSPVPLILLFGVIFLALLLNRNSRLAAHGEQPLFRLSIFDRRQFLTAWMGTMVFFLLMGALPFVIPLFLQSAAGYDSLSTGLVMAVFSLGSIILGLASGALVGRFHPRYVLQAFSIVTLLGVVWLFLNIRLDITFWQIALPLFVFGAGAGVLLSQSPNVTLSGVKPKEAGDAGAVQQSSNELSIGLGVAVIGSLLVSSTLSGIVDGVSHAADIALSDAERAAVIVEMEDAFQSVSADGGDQLFAALPAAVQVQLNQILEDSLVGAMQSVVGIMGLVVLLALTLFSFIPIAAEPDYPRKEQTAGHILERRSEVISYRQVHVIINPASGQDEPILNILNRVFNQADIEWELSLTRRAGDGTRLAREAVARGADLVVGYGGDGTQMEVANGLVGTGVPMAILPGGTGNSMAHALNVPRGLQPATELISRSHTTRAVDLAQMGDHYFMLRANTGTEEKHKATREEKDSYGNLAYIVEGVRLLRGLKPVSYTLTIDGQHIEVDGLSCIIFNAGSIGQYGTLNASIQVDDGLLDVLIVNTRLESALALASYALEIDGAQTGLHQWQGREVSVHADPPQPLWVDGEPFGETPFTIKVVPNAVNILVPEV